MILHKYVSKSKSFHNILVILANLFFSGIKIFRPKINSYENKCGIVLLHRLGDAIFTIPAVDAISKNSKESLILISFPETIPIYQSAFPELECVQFDHSDFWFSDRVAKPKTRKKIKYLKLKTIYDLTGTVRSATLIANYPAKKIVGLNEDYYKTIYTEYISIREKPHLTDNYLDVVRLFSPVSNAKKIIINSSSTGEYILIHPFASIKSKEWGLKKFIHLAIGLKRDYDCLIVSSPEQLAPDVKVELEKAGLNFKVTENISDLIEVIKKCTILIGNDSGPVHIANFFGKPTFTIYGPTNPDYHKPLYGVNKYILKNLPCSPQKNQKLCFTLVGYFCPSYECMESLSLNEVETSLKKYLIDLNIRPKEKFNVKELL